MSATSFARDDRLEWRARRSLGSSSEAVLAMVLDAVRSRRITGDRLVDVGCGQGALWRLLRGEFSSYCGIDAIRYDGFPVDGQFVRADLDQPGWTDTVGAADLVVAVETIEHLENPWAFMRDLVRVGAPGAWIIATTPNQLSWLSLWTLLVKQRFSAFTDTEYPVHRTALLEVDLRRLAEDCRLEHVAIEYSRSGRMPKTPWHYPRPIVRVRPRAFSDNVMMIGRKPRG